MTGVILTVSGLRLIGFACTVFALKHPVAVLVQYAAVFGSIGGEPLCDLARVDH